MADDVKSFSVLSSDDGSPRLAPNRRDVLAAAAAVLAGAAAGPAAAQPAGRTEGYFFVFSGPPGPPDPAAKRVFFISSEWLELFEVTDIYLKQGLDPAKVVENIRKSKPIKGKKPTKFDALYTDQADTDAIPGANYVPPPQPGPSQTYLAMMISPDDIPI